MRRSFSLWDADHAGGLAMEQLQEILKRHLGPAAAKAEGANFLGEPV